MTTKARKLVFFEPSWSRYRHVLTTFFESYYRLRPVTATFIGIHDHDHRLPDWSPDGLASAVDEMQALRVALEAARPPEPSLHDVGERDRQLAISFLDIQIAEHESPHFQRGNPSLAVAEAAFGLIALMTRPFAPAAERAAAAIARLIALPAFLEGAQRSIVRAVADEWRLKGLRECHGAEMLLVDGIPRWIAVEHLGDALARRLTDAADGARAAIDNLRQRLAQPTGHAADGGYACGSDMFDLLLTRGHWCQRSRAALLRG